MRNKAFSVQRSAFGEKQKLFTDKRGVTLVELMITLVIFSVVISMIYSVFNAFIKQATSERKVAKTEMDVINVAWPLLKEIQSAGFGVPSFSCSATNYQCACGIAVADQDGDGINDLIIHSTASGDSEHAGKWSYVGTGCAVTGLPTAAPDDAVVMNSLNKARMARTTVAAANTLDGCSSDWTGNIAYWYKAEAGDNIECYETIYFLQAYASPGDRPAMCEGNTRRVTRSSRARANDPSRQTILDCVFGADAGGDTGFNYRFGCINSSGALTWQAGTNCGTAKLRLIKVGIVIQSSPRRDIQSPATITLFEDLDSLLRVTIDLTPEQRNYKWRKLEQTITLKNLE